MSDVASLTTTKDIVASDPYYAYNVASIAIHWATVLGIIALFVLNGSAHASLGYLLALPLIYRAGRRFTQGMPRVCDQPIVINFIERLAIATMLISMIVLPLSGLLMPLLEGRSYDLLSANFGPSPWQGSASLAMINLWIHDLAAKSLLVGIVTHLLAASKHLISRQDGILIRIVRPQNAGK